MNPFYDSHFHVQNLTHPHLEAFIDRIRRDSKIAQLLLKPINPNVIDALLLVAPVAGLFRIVSRALKGLTGNHDGPTEAHLRILNLLVLMNRPIDEFLMAVNDEVEELIADENFKLKGERFDQVMISALIMDFTDRDYSSGWTKTIPYAQESKPVVRQTEDLLAGMKRYRETLVTKGNTAKVTVLPFLGMNPENYGVEPDKYVMLKAKLDQGEAQRIFNTAQSLHRAFYNPTSGRLTWVADEVTDQDVQELIAAIKPGQAQADVDLTLSSLRDFKARMTGGQVNTVSLLVPLDRQQISNLSAKFEFEEKAQGGLFTWTDRHMSDLERGAIIGALKKPNDDNSRGINAYTYSIGRIEFLFRSLENNAPITIEKLLNQFFGDTQVTRQQVIDNQEMWPGSIEKMGQGLFAGIKLYPPLGFDPNPGGLGESIHKNSRKKRAWYLYNFCEERQIPITVHTSDGGFQIMSDDLHYKFTSPKRWLGVLNSFPNLRINFAHCGVQDAVMNNGKHEWKRILFEQIICARKPDGSWAYPNTYTDVSDLLNTKEGYEQWEEGMAVLNLDAEQWKHLEDRILFGSDFMINLRESESYSNYLGRFVGNTPSSFPQRDTARKLQFLNEGLRYKMSVTNPERFHFPNG